MRGAYRPPPLLAYFPDLQMTPGNISYNGVLRDFVFFKEKTKKPVAIETTGIFLVETAGLEPVTSCV